MFNKICAAAFFAAASLSFASAVQADDIPATPMNHGPMTMRGMGPIGELANVGLMPVNVLAQPAIVVGGAAANAGGQIVGSGAVAANEPMAEPGMKKKRSKRMMKKKMMKKRM